MDELIPTRASLIQRLKNWQDQSSWQDFFDTYWKLIYDVGRKGGLTEAEAEDVVQETMISVAKHMPTFKYDPALGSFKAWLLNMTRWRMTDQLRKRAPLSSHEEARSDEPQPDEPANSGCSSARTIDRDSLDFSQLWDAEWERHLLQAALGRVKRRLDPEKYQVFDLYVNKEMAPERIASSFGIAVDQVYLIKHRVTEMIKQEVNRLEREMI